MIPRTPSSRSSASPPPPGAGLVAFAAWLGELSPRHRALRTPVYLEPTAPAAMRELWDAVGWSDALLETRPERPFVDPSAEKTIRGWFANPSVRERWGVSTPGEAMEAVRARLPRRHRFVRAAASTVFFVDDESGDADPRVHAMDEQGVASLAWPSYVEMILWQACRRASGNRSAEIASPPAPTPARPFAPALDGFWELAPGVWGLAPCPAYQDGAPPPPAQSWSVVYDSTPSYFRYVMGLPDGELERHFVSMAGMHYFGLDDGKRLDPEHPSIPGFRGCARPYGGGGTQHRGLVEVDGLRLWLDKLPRTTSTLLLAEPGQLAAVKAFLKREQLEIYQEVKPQRDPFAVEPRPAEVKSASKLHEQAQAQAQAGRTE